MNQVGYDEALVRMETLCARSEQCSSDIMKKLASMKLSSGDSARIMERLRELKFVDDRRFARSYCHDKLEFSGWGRLKISQGLHLKRINRAVISETLDEIDPDAYRTRAKSVIMIKVRRLGQEAFTREGRLKTLRFAMSRGFEGGLAAEIIRELSHEQMD